MIVVRKNLFLSIVLEHLCTDIKCIEFPSYKINPVMDQSISSVPFRKLQAEAAVTSLKMGNDTASRLVFKESKCVSKGHPRHL